MNLTITNKVSKAARRDIIELQAKINDFNNDKLPEDKFKHFRLTRGVYGQRQTGVQMIRTKLPFGKITTKQLIQTANVSDKYSTGNLHLTTRQNIQLHYVKLMDSPKVWSELEEVGVTLREACGNTVRNITASPKAGIDPHEPFDVSPYAKALFEYFLRNPISQDMGRKIKIAFSSSEADSAYTYIHDFGFIPKIKHIHGEDVKGFSVLVGGGLGAQSKMAQKAYDFLPVEKLIPFTEAAVRVFDRYGERNRRMKARLKFLIAEIGLDQFLELVRNEEKSLQNNTVVIDTEGFNYVALPETVFRKKQENYNGADYKKWLLTNVFEQKQYDYYAVQVRVPLGDISSDTARKLATLVKEYAADDIRITQNQGLILKYIRKETLPTVFNGLKRLGLHLAGFGKLHDITSCPGSDTCALAVTSSTGLATALTNVVTEEYPHLVDESNIQIKVSGCMNSCGQHMVANIGFHGSSIKKDGLVAPAMQIVLGGGVEPDGSAHIAEKVIKVPSKKAPQALRLLLNDYEAISENAEYFNQYFRKQGKKYFYELLKPLTVIEADNTSLFIDWGKKEQFQPEIGVGECAGVSLDVVGTIINEANEKLENAAKGLEENSWSDSIYNSYTSFVIGAKALLLSEDIQSNSQINTIKNFDEYFGNKVPFDSQSFEETVLAIRNNKPTGDFAKGYYNQAKVFLLQVDNYRQKQTNSDENQEKVVVSSHYKA